MLTREDLQAIREVVAETMATVLALTMKKTQQEFEQIHEEQTGKIKAAQGEEKEIET